MEEGHLMRNSKEPIGQDANLENKKKHVACETKLNENPKRKSVMVRMKIHLNS